VPLSPPIPEFRKRARDLAESLWREPATPVFLEEVRPAFEVPGRRKDGTVEGRNQAGHTLWSAVRGTVGGIASAIMSAGGGEVGAGFGRDGLVKGPPNALALALVDAARPADGAWLVHSRHHVAIIDTGSIIYDPKDCQPRILWHAQHPHAPRVTPNNNLLTWADGSTYQYVPSMKDAQYPG
jgi:hypothetical protein